MIDEPKGVSSKRKLNILHVTEAMGGGVVTLTTSLANRQSAESANVEVLHSVRNDTPSSEHLLSLFLPAVKLSRIESQSKLAGLLKMHSDLRNHYRKNTIDIVHLHSSIAGFIGRVARIGVRTNVRVFYSPHGFAFLRQNTSSVSRFSAKVIEQVLSNVGEGLILTSASERSLSETELGATRTFLLQTGVPSSFSLGSPRSEPSNERPTVGMVGRVTYQKAPWRFARVARELGHTANFVWLGGTDNEASDAWFAGSPVNVLGWMPPAQLATEMAKFDILLFPTLWEGFALSVAQAQMMGIPVVISDAIGNRDAISDGETGFICATDEDLVDATKRLIADSALRKRMSEASVQWARRMLVDDRVGHESIDIYTHGDSKTS